MSKSWILLALMFWMSSSCYSQEPDHYSLLRQDLGNHNIYDVIQDDDHHFWVSTNLGLYQFDGYKLKKLLVPFYLCKQVEIVSKNLGAVSGNDREKSVLKAMDGFPISVSLAL